MQKKPIYLIVGHGSPNPLGNKQLLHFVAQFQQALGEKVYFGALEHGEPSLEEALVQACHDRTSDTICVIPLFLFAAYHCKKDIPRYLQKAQTAFPNKKFHYAPALGDHPLMLEILHQALEQIEATSKITDPKKTLLLMIGRGTSEASVIDLFHQIAASVAKKWGFSRLETCFMAVNKPTFEEGLLLCEQTEAKRIIVIPYLLFYGALVEKISKSFQQLNRKRPDVEIHITQVLGNHPNLIKALMERSKEEVRDGSFEKNRP